MSDREALKKQITIEIQSLLCTEKDAISSFELQKSYRSLMGGHIPYVSLGFPTLDAFLRSIPEAVSCSQIGGVLHVKAVPQAGSAHIMELVRGQKKAKKKKSSSGPFNSQWSNRFKSFRVTSSVATKRPVVRNFNYTPAPRFVNKYEPPRVGTGTNSQSNWSSNSSSFDLRSKLTPQTMQPSNTNQRNLNTTYIAYQNQWKRVPTPPPSNSRGNNDSNRPSSSNSSVEASSRTWKDLAKTQFTYEDRANLKPQIMQPRTAPIVPSNPTVETSTSSPVREATTASQSRPVDVKESSLMAAAAAPTVQPRPADAAKVPFTYADRALLKPQIMQPRTPAIAVSKPVDNSAKSDAMMTSRHPISPIGATAIVDENQNARQTVPPNHLQVMEESMANLSISHPTRVSPVLKQANPPLELNESATRPLGPPPPPITSQWKLKEAKLILAAESKKIEPTVEIQNRFSPVLIKKEIQPEQQSSLGAVSLEELVRPVIPFAVKPKPAQSQGDIYNQPKSCEPAKTPDRRETAYRTSPANATIVGQSIRPIDSPGRPPLSEVAPPSTHRAPRVLLRNAVPVAPSMRRRPISPPASDRPFLPHVNGELYVERLKRLVTRYNLGPVSCQHYQMSNGRFVATVKVGQTKFFTFPTDFNDAMSAYEDAAKQACQHYESLPM